MKKALAIFGFSLFVTAASAQTQPAQMGITPTTSPEVLQTLDNTKTWVPLGTVDSSTHKFSVVGGGGGAAYPTHAALLAGVTTQTASPLPVSQQGFYAPGDGGDVVYQWNATSYCPGGNSGAPAHADNINCVLPSGQSPSAAGRYLMSVSGAVDVRTVGMRADGSDNSPFVSALMNVVGPPGDAGIGPDLIFPPLLGQKFTPYYFSQPFELSRAVALKCASNSAVEPEGSKATLVFAPGVDGIINESGYISADTGWGAEADIIGCGLFSMGISGAAMGYFNLQGTPVITAGGSGYGASVSGTMTYDITGSGASCTTVPYLNVTTNASGVIVSATIGNGGNCQSILHSAYLRIPGGGLSAGTGATFTTQERVTSFPNYFTGVTLRQPGFSSGGFPTFSVQAGDGILAYGGWAPKDSAPLVAPGAYAASVTAAPNQTVTLAAPYTVGQASYYFPIDGSLNSAHIYDLPVSQKYTIETTAGQSTLIVDSGPRPLKVGDFIWSDAFVFGAVVYGNLGNAIAGTPTVNTGGSGYTGTSGTMTWSGFGCSYGVNPVLNVTASGGAITGVTSVANAGNCPAFSPSSSATTWTPGGGLSGGSGASFNMMFHQTAQIGTPGYFLPPASVTHSAGSPGQMWVIPAGIMRRAGGQSHGVHVEAFPWGLEAACSNGFLPATGCNDMYDEHSTFVLALAGRIMLGDNTGASTSNANIYSNNSIADIIEAGSTGPSLYTGDNSNSAEAGTSIYGVIGLCGIEHTVYIGMYIGGSGIPGDAYCMGNDASGHPNIGVAVDPVSQATSLMIDTLIGRSPTIVPGFIYGNWIFGGFPFNTGEFTDITTGVATASGSVIAVNEPAYVYAGMAITDHTNPVIPANTTITSVAPGQVTISNPLTGGGVQVGDVIRFTPPPGTNGGCFEITGGINTQWAFAKDCGGSHFQTLSYNGFLETWLLGNGQPSLFITDSSYRGYQGGSFLVLPGGVELSNLQNFAGQERLLDSGVSPDARGSVIKGNVRLNSNPVPGGAMAWTETTIATATLTAPLAVGATSATVSSCPALAPPVGTYITDSIVKPGDLHLEVFVGTFASCTTGTLTLQSGAVNAASSSDVLSFLSPRPAGQIAKDAGGVVYAVGAATFVTFLPTCTPAIVGSAIVTDGLDYAGHGYGSVASSGGGVLNRPVFCDGANWTYH